MAYKYFKRMFTIKQKFKLTKLDLPSSNHFCASLYLRPRKRKKYEKKSMSYFELASKDRRVWFQETTFNMYVYVYLLLYYPCVYSNLPKRLLCKLRRCMFLATSLKAIFQYMTIQIRSKPGFN